MHGVERSAPGELVGRDRELGALQAFADRSDAGGLAVVHGPPGFGKSALLTAARADASARGLRVLSTAGAASEASLPYAGLERLLHGLVDHADRLAAPQRDALRAAVGLADATVTDAFLVGLATLNLLSEAASDGRLLAVVDDAQWLDPATDGVLAFVARRLEAEPVALVAGLRDGAAGGALTTSERALDLPLAPLDAESARALLDRTAPALPAAARRRVLAVARGNPLALVELPLAAGDTDGGLLPLTERLERAFGAQQADLAPATAALLRVAAADDGDVAAEILAATRRLAPGAGERDVDAAVEARLLERDGAHLVFRHPLVRSAMYQAATGEERHAAHAALAAVLAGDPRRRAWHRAAATTEPDDRVAAELEAAAIDARRRGALAEAARALQRAGALATVRSDAARRLLAAAELRAELGDTDAVARLIGRVEAFEPDPAARRRIRLLREPFADDASDDELPIRELLAEAEGARRDGDVDLALGLLLAAGTRCWWAVSADAPVRDAVVAETLRAGAGDQDPRVIAVLAATSAVRHGGWVIERLERACAVPLPDPAGAHPLGQAAHMVGHAELAVRQLARVEAQWRAQGRLARLAQALVMRAWSSIQLGNWPAVEPAAAEGARLACETGQPLWAAGARAALAAAAGARGEDARATALAAEVEAGLLAARPTNVLAVLQVARGVTALGAGRHAAAYDQLARMFDPADPAHHYAERSGGLSYLAEAALQCGRVVQAREVVEAVGAVAGGSPAALAQVGVGVARPFVSDSEPAFEAALAGPAARFPFHRARLLLAYGGWLRRSRRPADSRAPLRTGRDLFDALGTVPWAERARRELRASGETSRRREPEARDQLTPQELQIAQMAATGMSNPEIGERLFLSARTVASHLYRAFPKLGIASRRELAAALGDGDAN